MTVSFVFQAVTMVALLPLLLLLIMIMNVVQFTKQTSWVTY